MSFINLQSSDGKTYRIEEKIAKLSGTIKTMLEDCRMGESAETVIPLPNITARILEKYLEWATYHKDDVALSDSEEDESREKRSHSIPQWDYDFLKVDQGTLFELIFYLDTRGLMLSACKTVANMMKGKSPDQMRTTFQIKNDFISTEGESDETKSQESDERESEERDERKSEESDEMKSEENDERKSEESD